jgi:SAM-dependent methyltransferase
MNNKYEKLSKFYELCIPDFWIPFKKLFESNIPIGKYKILDLGCGTGVAFNYLEKYISTYKGVDHSLEMLNIARNNFPFLDFLEKDITEYDESLKNKYDIVLCAFDTINHILEKEDWLKIFNCSFNMLDKNGFFIFDICTTNDHQYNWFNYIDYQDKDNFGWLKIGNYNHTNHLAKTKNSFFIFDKETNLYQKETDIITQISFPINEIISMLNNANFHNITVYDLHFGTEVDENTSVASFFVKK